ncbi:MAG: hypothetical protein QOD92_448 [Acidimicrobiaceae bacterium]|jgi:hypothetical protein
MKRKKRRSAPEEGASANNDEGQHNDDDADDETRNPAGREASRQAARYRVQRNEARKDRDTLRAQLAFV